MLNLITQELQNLPYLLLIGEVMEFHEARSSL